MLSVSCFLAGSSRVSIWYPECVDDSEKIEQLARVVAERLRQLPSNDGHDSDDLLDLEALDLPEAPPERIYGDAVEAVASLKAAVLEVQDDLITQWFEGGGKLKTLARLGRLPRTTLIRRRRELEDSDDSQVATDCPDSTQ